MCRIRILGILSIAVFLAPDLSAWAEDIHESRNPGHRGTFQVKNRPRLEFTHYSRSDLVNIYRDVVVVTFSDRSAEGTFGSARDVKFFDAVRNLYSKLKSEGIRPRVVCNDFTIIFNEDRLRGAMAALEVPIVVPTDSAEDSNLEQFYFSEVSKKCDVRLGHTTVIGTDKRSTYLHPFEHKGAPSCPCEVVRAIHPKAEALKNGPIVVVNDVDDSSVPTIPIESLISGETPLKSLDQRVVFIGAALEKIDVHQLDGKEVFGIYILVDEFAALRAYAENRRANSPPADFISIGGKFSDPIPEGLFDSLYGNSKDQ